MKHHRTPRTGLLSGALLAALALAGCGDDSDSGAEAPTAADGTDYTACEDGECEVAVSEPTDIVFLTAEGDVTLSITEVTENGIELSTTFPTSSGENSGTLGGLCESLISANFTSSSCYGGGTLPEPDPAPGELVLQLLGMNDGAAILRLAMG